MSLGFNHAGIGVADIDAGVAFYRDALGCSVLRPPFDVVFDGPGGEQAVDVLASRPFRRMRMAHLVTANGIGIELFELVDPRHEPRVPALEYWKSGVFHVCFTTPDIEESLRTILEMGGTQVSRVWVSDESSKKMVYCTDPWGTVIELYTHDYTETYGPAPA